MINVTHPGGAESIEPAVEVVGPSSSAQPKKAFVKPKKWNDFIPLKK
jgi:hypothetical protein